MSWSRRFSEDQAYKFTAGESPTNGMWAEELVEQMKGSNFEERGGLESRKAMRLDRKDTELDEGVRAALPEDVRSDAAMVEVSNECTQTGPPGIEALHKHHKTPY